MVRFKFFVHCTGWKDGGYENTHYAETAKDAERIVANWNAEGRRTTLLSIEPISDAEFAQDYIY
jgi:hypothetical protein